MPYSVIQPPFTLKFREMSRRDLRNYFQWFLAIIPQRIDMLVDSVKNSRGFESWQPNYKPPSLDPLGIWFASQVRQRQRTKEESEEIEGSAEYPIDLPGEELTNRTFSLAMDIGMYLSQVFLRNHPSLHWEQPLSSMKFVDYGQPVLVKFSFGPLNPVRLVIALAYGLAKGTAKDKELRDIYDIWSSAVSGESPKA